MTRVDKTSEIILCITDAKPQWSSHNFKNTTNRFLDIFWFGSVKKKKWKFVGRKKNIFLSLNIYFVSLPLRLCLLGRLYYPSRRHTSPKCRNSCPVCVTSELMALWIAGVEARTRSALCSDAPELNLSPWKDDFFSEFIGRFIPFLWKNSRILHHIITQSLPPSYSVEFSNYCCFCCYIVCFADNIIKETINKWSYWSFF